MKTEVTITVKRDGNEVSKTVELDDMEAMIGRVDNVLVKFHRADDIEELLNSYEVEGETNHTPDGA